MRVDEIFGPTIAGEGSIAGAVTMFVRLGGCDYRCSWCDTLHAVDPTNAPRWMDMEPDGIVDAMEQLAPDLAPGTWVSISGGNPAIWQTELPQLVKALQKASYRVNIETQGSVPNEAFREADVVTISPKGPSSGMVTDREKLARCIMQAQSRAVLKFVVGTDEDLEFARDITREHRFNPIFVQPLTDARTLSGDRYRWLCETVATDPALAAWRVIPQLHVLAWGGDRGH